MMSSEHLDWLRPHRTVCPVRLQAGQEWEVDEAVHHHLVQVLRLRADEPFVVADGRGREHWLEPSQLSRRRLAARVLAVREVLPPERRLHLVAALLKPDPWRWLLEKGTEAGVWAFHPVCAGRSGVWWRPEDHARKADRWRRLVEGAAAQSRRAWLPEIHTPCPLRGWITGWERRGPVIVADLKQAVPVHRLPLDWSGTTDLALCIGPEGGWMDEERVFFREQSWPCVQLGPHVMRAETAGTVGAALLLETWRAAECEEGGPE